MDTSLIARGGVPVQLDRERIVWFGIDSTWLLIRKYGMAFWRALLVEVPNEAVEGEEPSTHTELASMEALQFFLWVGLQEDAKRNGETLTFERVADFVKPMTVQTLVSALTIAITEQNFAPAPEGKAEAAPASPAAPSPVRASTLRKRGGSPSASSNGRRKRSSKHR